VVKAYASDGALVAPIVFTEASVTLGHIQALFTPPEKMPGASSILGTVELIISQLEEPFDLQSKLVIPMSTVPASHQL
jgi:hypothetical protein